MSIFSNKHRRTNSYPPIPKGQSPSHESDAIKIYNLDKNYKLIKIDNNKEKENINQNLIIPEASQYATTKSSVERYRMLTKPYIPKLRLVHLDLKGAPPKIAFFKEVLSLCLFTNVLIQPIFSLAFPFAIQSWCKWLVT